MEFVLDWIEGLSVPAAKRKPAPNGFGRRLAALRQSRGLTQEALGEAVGISNRMVAYYEREGAVPPGPLLTEFARELNVSTDELLGARPLKNVTSPKTARLIKRLQRVSELPSADQRAVLKMVDALLETRQGRRRR